MFSNSIAKSFLHRNPSSDGYWEWTGFDSEEQWRSSIEEGLIDTQPGTADLPVSDRVHISGFDFFMNALFYTFPVQEDRLHHAP